MGQAGPQQMGDLSLVEGQVADEQQDNGKEHTLYHAANDRTAWLTSRSQAAPIAERRKRPSSIPAFRLGSASCTSRPICFLDRRARGHRRLRLHRD